MSTLQSENSLIINRANNRSANMIVGNTNEEEVNTEIFIPDKNFNYIGNKPEDTDSNETSQFMVTTTNQPKNFSGLNEVENLILKYVKSDGTIQWVKDLESLGDFPNKISQTISRTLPLGDFFTDIQTNVDNYNTSTDNETEGSGLDSKYKWVNLNATIIDVGLHQLTWNTNKQYYHITDNLENPTSSSDTYKNFPLHIECSDTEDKKLNLKIKYLKIDSDKEETSYICNIENYNPDSVTRLDCYKINSVEIVPSTTSKTYNLGEIELYFKVSSGEQSTHQTQFNNGIEQLTVQAISAENCFTYNCDYLNYEYYNMYFNRNINFRSTESTNINDSNTSITHLSSITDVLFPNSETTFELEGGRGRKAVVQIKRESAADNSDVTFKIINPGYLYEVGDLLRIKDKKYRNLIYFTVGSLKSGSSATVLDNTRFTQEIIKTQHGKSNTIKYCLGKKETLLLKDLTISGSTEAKILVRLIQISKPNNNVTIPNSEVIGNNGLLSSEVKNTQKVLKEFYYFKRTNINDTHHINQYILQGSEFYIDVQKLLEATDNDTNLLDTLTFNLNGIKIDVENGSAANTFIMQRDI
jgi:hypothetical protein